MYSYIHKCAHDACPQAASGWLIDETKAPPRITKKTPETRDAVSVFWLQLCSKSQTCPQMIGASVGAEEKT